MTLRCGLGLGGIALLALLLRLSWPGSLPLSAGEAQRALAGWQLVHGGTPGWWSAPVLVSGTGITFLLLGDGDAMARLLPALAGTGTVLALVLLRPWLGQVGAFTGAMLLALSPGGIATGHRVGEETIVGLLTLLLGWTLVRGWDRRDGVMPLLIAIGYGALLELGYSGLVGAIALLLFLLLWPAVRPQKAGAPAWLTDYRLLFPLGATLVLAGTGGLLYLDGLGVPSLAQLSQHFDSPAAQGAWYQPWLALAGFEPLALLLGLPAAGLALARWSGRPLDPAGAFAAFLAIWSALGLLFLLVGGTGDLESLYLTALPLSLLTGSLVAEGLGMVDRESVRQFALALPIVLACAVFGGLNILRATTEPAAPGAWLGAAALIMAASVAGVVSLGATRPPAVAALFASVFGLVLLVHSASRLSSGWPGEPQGQSAIADLLHDRTYLSAYTVAGRAANVDVAGPLQDPVAWYLRGIPGVKYLPQVRRGPALLVAEEADTLADTAGYRRTALSLSESWSPAGWSGQDALRWLATGAIPDQSRSSHRVAVYTTSESGA